MNYFHDTAGHSQPPPMRMRPHKNALWYAARPKGRVHWEGPGWYTLGAKNTLLIKVG